MNNNLEELSKPTAYKFDHGVMGPGDFKYGTPQMHSAAKDENASPLYSQEYVSALIAERDAWEASALAIRDEWKERGERIAELEAKLSTPVLAPDDGLDDCIDMWPGNCADDFDTGYKFGLWRYEQNIRAAGFKVEGEA